MTLNLVLLSSLPPHEVLNYALRIGQIAGGRIFARLFALLSLDFKAMVTMLPCFFIDGV
jgi:hypothetical protein